MFKAVVRKTFIMIAHILVVEDSPSDARLIGEAFRDLDSEAQLHFVENGEEALDFILRRGKYQTARRPDLVLLDLNLPRKSGAEVLDELKNDRLLKEIPVIVLTSSNAREDVTRAYASQANGYVTKPGGLDEFNSAIRSIYSFWLNTAELPTRIP